ncbi:hypothetical protein ACG1BZ_00955 [Microbulbifer sp. CNSA002]|uniref:hypothetical protein n=1 Tax=unclassified Microbulbifer TaxID=2619833 RepID=UPI0039B512D4
MKLGKLLYFTTLSILLAACSGGGGSGGSDSDNGELPDTSGGGGSQSVQFTIQGLIGESIDDVATVRVKVGDTDYDATVDGKVFSAEIMDSEVDDLVSIVVSYPANENRKEVILKSYVGDVSLVEARENDGLVSVDELPTLYVNAMSTAAAAFLEKVNGGEITLSTELLNASQVLPQEMLLESAVGLRYVISGGESPLFSHDNTYEFIQDYPVAAKVALQLKNTSSVNAENYEDLLAQLLSDSEQITPVEGYSGEDVILVAADPQIERIHGFVMNLSGEESGSGQFIDDHYDVETINPLTYVISDNKTILDVSGWDRSGYFPEECTADGSSSAKLNSIQLTKYYDAAFYSAYKIDYAYSCESPDLNEANAVNFQAGNQFAQVNIQRAGDLKEIASAEFSIAGFRDQSGDSNFSYADSWQPSIITPNANGTIDQRFDLLSGYKDGGVLSFNDAGNLVIESNRGVKVEYYTFGAYGAAIRTLGVLRRADGSLVSVGGHFATPVVRGTVMPAPSDIFNYGGIFDLLDSEFPSYQEQFGLRYFADGSGTHVSEGSEGITESGFNLFSWSDTNIMREHRYFVDPTTSETFSSCPADNVDCVEWRYREVEPLFFDGTYYYLRVYQELDYCKLSGIDSCKEASGYIDRWTLSAIQ